MRSGPRRSSSRGPYQSSSLVLGLALALAAGCVSALAADEDCLIQGAGLAAHIHDDVDIDPAQHKAAVLLDEPQIPKMQHAVDAPDAPHGKVRDWAEIHRVKLCIVFVTAGMIILRYAQQQVVAYEAAATTFSPPWHSDSGVLVRVVASVLACWIIAGMASFCLFMRFTDSGRHLTLAEAFYLCMQILTTVGYGDFTPTTREGMVFMAIYLLLGVSVVAALIGELLAWFTQQQEQALPKLAQKRFRRKRQKTQYVQGDNMRGSIMVNADSESVDSEQSEKSEQWQGELSENEQSQSEPSESEPVATREEPLHSGKPSVVSDTTQIMSFLLPQLFLFLLGVLFFHLWPGENKSLGEAFYMCSVTMTTVGFGAYHPVTQAGFAFSAVWMLLSVWFTGRLIAAVAEVVFRRRRKASTEALAAGLLEQLASSGETTVSQMDFLRLELVRGGYVKQKDIDRILSLFNSLDTNRDGCLDLDELAVGSQPTSRWTKRITRK